MEVFYNTNDELICTATYIDMSCLPDAAQETIQHRYEGYTCNNVIKCVDADGITRYYAELENNKKTVILQSDLEGYTSVFKTTKK